MNNPERPFTAIVGGSKVKDKIDVINKMIEIADNIIIGGGFLIRSLKRKAKKSANPWSTTASWSCARFIEKAKKLGKNFLIPVDIVVADDFSANANTKIVDRDGIPADWEGIDIGPKTREIYAE